jgi:GT2 family glycosyltransferase
MRNKNIYPKVSIIVSVVVLNQNSLKYTIRTLEYLKKITYPNYEVILVDNGLSEKDAEILKEKYRGFIKIIKNKENSGISKGENMAIKEAVKEKETEYIVFLHNDNITESDFLDQLVKSSQSHPEAGSIQAKMPLKEFNLIDAVGLEYSRNGLGFHRGIYESVDKYTQEEEIFGCCGRACLYKKEALEDIKIDDKYFDEDFFTTYEDVDLAFRLQWAGWKSWYCPEAIVFHSHFKEDAPRAPSKSIIYHSRRNQIWTWLKNFPFIFILKNLHWLLLIDIIQIGLDLLRKRFVGIKGKFDAYSNLEKVLKKRKKIKKKVDFSEIEKWLILQWKIPSPYYSYFKKTLI